MAVLVLGGGARAARVMIPGAGLVVNVIGRAEDRHDV